MGSLKSVWFLGVGEGSDCGVGERGERGVIVGIEAE